MPFTAADLQGSPNPLAAHYKRFRVADRLLLSGHSHQAWPDRGFEGQQRAWLDAAEHVDEKWPRAMDVADRVRAGYRRLLDDPDGLYSLAGSTHDLLIKLLSALPLATRPRLVATDQEFHSLRRQLTRLEESGLEIERVRAKPVDSVGERLAAATDDRTAAVFCSTVFYSTAEIAGDLTPAAEACRRHGAIFVLDLYHQLNAVPFSLRARGFEDAYAVGGGYKYCQLGEGNAFLRFPPDCGLRPAITGWYAEFGRRTERVDPGRVAYDAGDDRFAGATYDPTSHYRAAEVFDFFAEHALTPELLREVNQHQVGRLQELFDGLDLDPASIDRDRDMPLERRGGFLTLDSPRAGDLYRGLRDAGVFCDHRGTVLRLGPAPYVADSQLEAAMGILGELAREPAAATR